MWLSGKLLIDKCLSVRSGAVLDRGGKDWAVCTDIVAKDIYRPKTRRGGIGFPAPKIHINYLQLVKTLTWHLTLLQSKLSAMIMTYKSLWYVEYIFKVLEFSLQMIRCLAPLNTGLWSMLKTWCHSQMLTSPHLQTFKNDFNTMQQIFILLFSSHLLGSINQDSPGFHHKMKPVRRREEIIYFKINQQTIARPVQHAAPTIESWNRLLKHME